MKRKDREIWGSSDGMIKHGEIQVINGEIQLINGEVHSDTELQF